MIELIGICYFALVFLFLYRHYTSYGLTPALVFVLMQSIMFAGIALYADARSDTDMLLLLIYLIALVLFSTGVMIAASTFRKRREKKAPLQLYLNVTQRQFLLFIAFTAVAICLWFTLRAGGNVFSMMLQSLSRGESTDFSQQRSLYTFTAGSGYVYQFRVFLLPIITAYLVTCERNLLRNIGYFLFPVMMFVLLASGQRGGFVIFALMWLAALHNLSASAWLSKVALLDRRKTRRAYVVSAVVFTALFTLLTYYNGRHVASGGMFAAIVARLLHDNQVSALVAFEYITSVKIQYGQDWAAMFWDLLPGQNGYITLANRVHAMLWGSFRGSAPPCVWGSAYYNWGFPGILVMPFCLGYLYQSLHYYYISKASSRFDVFLYSALTVSLGTWVADSPIILFTDGSLALIMLWAVVSLAGHPLSKQPAT